jgi:DNA polymerase-3 subunit chi
MHDSEWRPMTDILFYHLTESKLEDALPPILEKSLERGWRVAIQATQERCQELDTHLWCFRDDAFLPHGQDDGSETSSQPILLTIQDHNPNSANVRMFIDGAQPQSLEGYERAVFMFDGFDAAQLQQARANWKELKAAGHALTYWQQAGDGRWQKKA